MHIGPTVVFIVNQYMQLAYSAVTGLGFLVFENTPVDFVM